MTTSTRATKPSIPDPALSLDAVVFALARTALPFARTRLEEAERWLRIVRVHGEVGAALQKAGVGEGPLESRAEEPEPLLLAGDRYDAVEVVELICEHATELARRSDAACVATAQVLLAVVEAYGPAFDHQLYRYGTTRRRSWCT